MSGQQAVLDHFLDRLSRFGGIDLAVTYGSFGTPWATATSDVDIFFVPADDAARSAAEQVIVGDIGYDLWAVDWSRLERIADLSETLTGLLLGSNIVLGDAAARGRFEELRQRCVANLAEPTRRLNAAKPLLDRAAAVLGRTGGTDRGAIAEAVGSILAATAFLNGEHLASGPGRILDDGASWLQEDLRAALALALLEPGDEDRAVGLRRALGLADRRFADVLGGVNSGPVPAAVVDHATGWYEELQSTLVKIPRAVRSRRSCTAILAALSAEEEIAAMHCLLGLKDQDLPDLVAALDDADAGEAAVRATADRLQTMLAERGVVVRRYSSPADLTRRD